MAYKMTYADYYGNILSNRTSITVKEYIPKDQRRRMQVCEILGRYLFGASRYTYQSLADSYADNWVDSGLMHQLAGLMAELVTLGMRPRLDDPEKATKVHEALQRVGFYKACRQAVRDASATGDAVVDAGFDAERMRPRLDVYLGGMYVPIDRYVKLVYWSEAVRDEEIFIRRYELGDKAVEQPDGYVKTGKQAVLKLEGYVKEEQETAMRNVVPIQSMVRGTPAVLPCSGIPLVHFCNQEADRQGFGVSDFWAVLTLLDCYNEVVTDMRQASRFIIPGGTVWGDNPPGQGKNGRVDTKYAPGTYYYVGQNGGMALVDTSNLLTAADKQRLVLFGQIVQGMGLCKAMVGDVGEISNRRDREVRLMYLPGKLKVEHRRVDFAPLFTEMAKYLGEFWKDGDAAGYGAAVGDTDLSGLEWEWDDILPEDIGERIMMIGQTRTQGLLDRETATGQAIAALGIDADAAAVAKKAEAEDARGLMGAFPPNM